jgi:hypothetical protein
MSSLFDDLPSEEEQFLQAIKLSQQEEEKRKQKELEEEKIIQQHILQKEQEELELLNLDQVSKKIDNGKFKKKITEYLDPHLEG